MENDSPKQKQKMKLAISLNIIAPYRLPIYSELAKEFDTVILHGGQEANRSWKLQVPEHVKTHSVWTMQVPVVKQTGVAGVKDTSYFHVNLGLLWAFPQFRPDVLISNEMGLRTAIAILYGKIARVPVWVWWGGSLHTERFVSNWKRLWRALIVGNVNRWISYGRTSTEYLESMNVKRENILEIQNCVQQETFLQIPPPESKRFQDKTRPVILTVGQLIDRKGLDKLIEACGRLAARGRKFSLVIVGKGPERERLTNLAEDNKLEDFLIISNQSPQELNATYRSADAFVFPTMEDVWGLVVNEAMWAGLPVLCSQYAGCAKELVPSGNIFDPTSAASFDGALEKIFDGTISPSDLSKLRTWQDVSTMICNAIRNGTPVAANPPVAVNS